MLEKILFDWNTDLKSSLVAEWIVNFISIGEKCLFCRYTFSGASLYSSRRVKWLFWLRKKVRHSLLRPVPNPQNTEEISKPFLGFPVGSASLCYGGLFIFPGPELYAVSKHDRIRRTYISNRKKNTEWRALSEFSLGMGESEGDERYLWF